MRKFKNILNNEKGEGGYISAVVFVMIAAVLMLFVVQLGGVIANKVSLDANTKQIVKKMQLEGGLTQDAWTTIAELDATYQKDLNNDGDCNDRGESATLEVDTPSVGNAETIREVQLGDSFTVKVTVENFIGFGEIGVWVPLTSTQVGVSEKYWKELG